MAKNGRKNKLGKLISKQKIGDVVSFNINKLTPLERFNMKYIERDGCWLWKNAIDKINPHKHMLFAENSSRDNKKTVMASHFSYEYYKEKVQPKHIIIRNCGNNACVNPDHLEMKSVAWRNKKYSYHAKLTHCKRCNTELTPISHITVKLRRRCEPCFQASVKKYEDNNKDKITERSKKHYEENKDHLISLNKIRNEKLSEKRIKSCRHPENPKGYDVLISYVKKENGWAYVTPNFCPLKLKEKK